MSSVLRTHVTDPSNIHFILTIFYRKTVYTLYKVQLSLITHSLYNIHLIYYIIYNLVFDYSKINVAKRNLSTPAAVWNIRARLQIYRIFNIL